MRAMAPRPIAALALLLIVPACGTTPAPPNMPPPIPSSEMAGLPGVPYSEIVEAAGAPAAGSGAVAKGQALVTIPYRYRHTAVLIEDVKGFSFTVRGTQAPAGAPGYYAGTFTAGYTPKEGAPFDMWCFLPRVAGGSREHLCLLRDSPGLAAIAPTRENPWLWHSFSPATGTFDYVKTPIFERRAVDLPGDLTLEYRFQGWRDDRALVALHAVGRHVVDLYVPRDTSGDALLRTIAGSFLISANAADPAAARIVPAPN